jgi:hypothetical protein
MTARTFVGFVVWSYVTTSSNSPHFTTTKTTKGTAKGETTYDKNDINVQRSDL